MELIRMTARQVLALLDAGEASPADLLEALRARIGAVDGPVNALPTLCFERAFADIDRATGRGVLRGLPVAIKDLANVAGVRTTHGSPIYADHVPEVSDHVVERIEDRGGIVFAKSNTPEFGAGASTFNEVFGRTANPWNLSRSAAGSSGGAAAALASGTAWLAHGSDMGGSLRNPASFCGVVGLRPSPGLIPRAPSADAFGTLAQEGPMARNVADLALLLDAMAGADPREPLGFDAEDHLSAALAPRMPLRVAYSPDLGITPVDPEVAAVTEAAAWRCEALGARVDLACPDFDGAHEAFQTLRAVSFAAGHQEHYRDKRDLLKPDIVWNIERGLALTGADVARATRLRTALVERMAAFLGDYDLLLCPTTIVPPFPVEDRTVTRCNGVEFETYIDWLAIVYAITLTGAPALSLPCGFTADGLPVGLQMIAPVRGEKRLLAAAAALEAELGLDLGPIDPRGADGAEAQSGT